MFSKILVALAVVAALAVATLIACVARVPEGHVGVVTVLGSNAEDDTLKPGIHLTAPWKFVANFSTQTQEDLERAVVPTREGLSLTLEATLLYHLDPDEVVNVYRKTGTKYREVVVGPQFRSALRDTTVKYDAKSLYTADRQMVENTLEAAVKEMLRSRGVVCEKVLLREMALPDLVRTSIERKLAMEQDAAAMEFSILKEKKEAQRRVAEAKGIADSQHIIQGTLTDAYLRYLWIKGLETAAKHDGTIIYVPADTHLFKEVNSVPPKRKTGAGAEE